MVPAPTSQVSGNGPYMSSVHQQGGPRQSPGPLVKMSELFQAVPPNVSVSDAPQNSLESIMLQVLILKKS
jgi:hypothetical protein